MKFSELTPRLSDKILNGLSKANYLEMTEVQEAAIPQILSGKDVLASAKTGSGKTLAFLIPMLQLLTNMNISRIDGPSALIIAPTRELALQSFEVLRRIGCQCTNFSAGLVIGGKSFKEESDTICMMNIIISTPGRLLQHMDQTEGFELRSLKLLILDEADKILELGFSASINAILAGLPPSTNRQTLLFSATQTSNVKELARLSLRNPISIQVHHPLPQREHAVHAMPESLQQFFMKVAFEKKFEMLYSFVRSHLKSKILVFVSSCKQVRFVYEAFCKLRPGIPVTCLHGKQSQFKRIALFKDFCSRNSSMMIATDIASRGLDFPLINWVIHMDAPDSLETYVHRCGRTARYHASGNSLLFLTPFELKVFPFFSTLPDCQEIMPAASKILSIEERLESICVKYAEIKYLASCAMLSYIRSIVLLVKSAYKKEFAQPLKHFVEELDLEKLAQSWGLVDVPIPVKQFISTVKSRLLSQGKSEPQEPDFTAPEDNDEELFVPKPADQNQLAKEEPSVGTKIETATRQKKKKRVSINELGCSSLRLNTKVVFDDDGNIAAPINFTSEDAIDVSADSIGQYMQKRSLQLSCADERDRELHKEKRKEKRQKKKKSRSQHEGVPVTLGTGDSQENLESLALSMLEH